MKKLLILIVFFFISIPLLLFSIRLLTGEDNWICQKGEWIKHGQPNSPKPEKECPKPLAVINKQTIYLTIAETPEEKAKGLSSQQSMPESQGMIFVFDQAGRHSFWMKDMLFDLDFVFIKGNQIVDIIGNVPFPKKNETPLAVNSRVDFDKVIELNQGITEKTNIGIGDKVQFKNF